jgi:hypothetical protein
MSGKNTAIDLYSWAFDCFTDLLEYKAEMGGSRSKRYPSGILQSRVGQVISDPYFNQPSRLLILPHKTTSRSTRYHR